MIDIINSLFIHLLHPDVVDAVYADIRADKRDRTCEQQIGAADFLAEIDTVNVKVPVIAHIDL